MTIQGKTKILLHFFLGGFVGLLLYCCVIFVKELRHLFGRDYYDWEGVLYQCLLPLNSQNSPALLSKKAWSGTPLWVNAEALLGLAMTVGGAVFAARRVAKKASGDERTAVR